MVHLRIGSRAQVMHGNAKMTAGGLKKKDLKYNKRGRIVSRKASRLAKKNNRLVKAGFVTKKGVFGVAMKGGMYTSNNGLGGPRIENRRNILRQTHGYIDRLLNNSRLKKLYKKVTRGSIIGRKRSDERINKELQKIKSSIQATINMAQNKIRSRQNVEKYQKIRTEEKEKLENIKNIEAYISKERRSDAPAAAAPTLASAAPATVNMGTKALERIEGLIDKLTERKADLLSQMKEIGKVAKSRKNKKIPRNRTNNSRKMLFGTLKRQYEATREQIVQQTKIQNKLLDAELAGLENN